jgi:hypothetical protein
MSNSSSPKKTNSINNLKQKQGLLIKNQTIEEPDNKKGNKGSYAKEYNKNLKSSFDKYHSIPYLYFRFFYEKSFR